MKTFTRRAALAACLALLAGCGSPRTAAPEKPAPRPKPRPRAEFKELLVGKTQGEVIEAMGGKPDMTAGGGTASDVWHYREVSYDPVTEKTDGFMGLIFGDDGRVRHVSFN